MIDLHESRFLSEWKLSLKRLNDALGKLSKYWRHESVNKSNENCNSLNSDDKSRTLQELFSK